MNVPSFPSSFFNNTNSVKERSFYTLLTYIFPFVPWSNNNNNNNKCAVRKYYSHLTGHDSLPPPSKVPYFLSPLYSILLDERVVYTVLQPPALDSTRRGCPSPWHVPPWCWLSGSRMSVVWPRVTLSVSPVPRDSHSLVVEPWHAPSSSSVSTMSCLTHL